MYEYFALGGNLGDPVCDLLERYQGRRWDLADLTLEDFADIDEVKTGLLAFEAGGEFGDGNLSKCGCGFFRGR